MRKIEDRFGITSARYKRTECFRRIRPEKLAHELRSNNMQDVLLLDLREKDDFESFHIRVSAHSAPAGGRRAAARVRLQHLRDACMQQPPAAPR